MYKGIMTSLSKFTADALKQSDNFALGAGRLLSITQVCTILTRSILQWKVRDGAMCWGEVAAGGLN